MAYVKPHTMKPMDKPYKLISLEDNRFKLCNIKTLNLIPSVLANQRALEAGCDEAALFDSLFDFILRSPAGILPCMRPEAI